MLLFFLRFLAVYVTCFPRLRLSHVLYVETEAFLRVSTSSYAIVSGIPFLWMHQSILFWYRFASLTTSRPSNESKHNSAYFLLSKAVEKKGSSRQLCFHPVYQALSQSTERLRLCHLFWSSIKFRIRKIFIDGSGVFI